MSYFRNVLIALDQLGNALLGGWPDETISSRMGRSPDCRVCNFICRLLDKIDARHCARAVMLERTDAQQPPDNRSK